MSHFESNVQQMGIETIGPAMPVSIDRTTKLKLNFIRHAKAALVESTFNPRFCFTRQISKMHGCNDTKIRHLAHIPEVS